MAAFSGFDPAFERDWTTFRALWQGTWADPPLHFREPRFILGVDRAINEERPMTQQEWEQSSDPATMLNWARAAIRGDTTPSVLPDGFRAMSDRKARLFACACARQVWHLLDQTQWRHAVEVAEMFADGLVTTEDLEHAHTEACRTNGGPAWLRWLPASVSELSINWSRLLRRATCNASALVKPPKGIAAGVIAALLRSMVNPFAPLTLGERCERKGYIWPEVAAWEEQANGCPSCKGSGSVPPDWLTSTVKALAEAAYESRLTVCSECNGPLIQSANYGPRLYCVRCRVYPAMPATNGRLDQDRLGVLADCMEEAGCCDPAWIMPLRGFSPCPHSLVKVAPVGEWPNATSVISCEDCEGSGWLPRPVPAFRGAEFLDVLLGRE